MKTAIVIGGGPAGLTAAYELLERSDAYRVVVLEASDIFGGISRTVAYHGNRMDMGGHRFFSKSAEVNAWWEKMLPMQGAPAADDLELGRDVPLAPNGPDPEAVDEVMLTRNRVSRIYFDGKFYDYPISLKPQTLANMGIGRTLSCGFSYLGATMHKLPEDNLENFYINCFGKRLYSMFFENYTENLWGRHPNEIDASWGAQRTKGLSIGGIIKDVVEKGLNKKDRDVNTSLIEEFKYPKLGPGQLWEVVAKKVQDRGGTILMHAKAVGFHKEGDRITSVTYVQDGVEKTLDGDVFISSMPIKDLVNDMNDVPAEPLRIARGLPYRDYMTLGVLVKRLALKNLTDVKTIGGIIPDCWVYVQDRNVQMGRFQVYNNWSPYLVKDNHETVWVGLEYFCNDTDAFWNQTEEEFTKLGVKEMIQVGLIASEDDVLDSHMEKVEKAYPAYFDTYDEIDTLIEYLSSIGNLYCVGRNGQHRYNNLDHSMMTSFEAVTCILEEKADKSAIWNVNTEESYHESN